MTPTMQMTVLLGVLCSIPASGYAQSHDFPTLNSLGRYFGAGYTLGGYHSLADGRLQDSGHLHGLSCGCYVPPCCPTSSATCEAGMPQPQISPYASVGGSCGCPPAAESTPVFQSVEAVRTERMTPSPAPRLEPIQQSPDSVGPEQVPLPPDAGTPEDPDTSPSDRRSQGQAAGRQAWPVAYRSFPSLASLRQPQPPRQSTPLQDRTVQDSSPQNASVPPQVNRYRQSRLDSTRQPAR